MNSIYRRVAVLVTTVATISFGLLVGPASATASTASATRPASPSWYLALGDSVAAGFQPGLGDNPTGGYVGHVLDALRHKTPNTQLQNLACSGETSTSLINGGKCRYAGGSQLAQALIFLHAHGARTRLITLTIGADDVTPCVKAADITACVSRQLPVLANNLRRVLARVHAAAPHAKIVTTNYYNPYLAFWFTSPALARTSATLQAALNATIGSVTRRARGVTADVATAFRSRDTRPVGSPPVPTNVAVICRLTWMCTRNNIHPNNAGYAVIAAAVVVKLP